MASDSAQVSHFEARRHLDFPSRLHVRKFARSVGVSGDYTHVTSEAREIQAKPILCLRRSAVATGRSEVGTDVQYPHGNLAALRLAEAVYQCLILLPRLL